MSTMPSFSREILTQDLYSRYKALKAKVAMQQQHLKELEEHMYGSHSNGYYEKVSANIWCSDDMSKDAGGEKN